LIPITIASVGLDFDDVLVDTFPLVMWKIKRTAEVMGLEVPDDERIASCYDYAREMCQRLFPEASADKFLEIYYAVDIPYRPVDGAKEALDFLSSSGVMIWTFTGARTRELVRQRSIQAGIDPSLLYLIITGAETRPYKKPHRKAWEICRREIRTSGIEPEKALFVEDSLENYHRARESGLQAVLLLGSPNSRGYEHHVPPEDVLHSMRQLPEFALRRY